MNKIIKTLLLWLTIVLAVSIVTQTASANIFEDISNIITDILQRLKPEQLYIYGSVPISSNPSGATVKLDGVYIGTTSCQIINCNSGSFMYYSSQSLVGKVLTFEKTGYVTQSQVFFTNGAMGVTLVPVSGSKYNILVYSSPSGASVTDYNTNTFLGTTPFSLGLNFNEQRTIRFNKAGYDEVSRNVNYNSAEAYQIMRLSYVAPIPTPYYAPPPVPTQAPYVQPTNNQPYPTYNQPTPSPTPLPTVIPTPQQYVCDDGSIVLYSVQCPNVKSTEPSPGSGNAGVKILPDPIKRLIEWILAILGIKVS